jgi:peptidoglycan/xylan/chitin deacetylase (PgdA/CDA1 family)
MLAEMGVKRLMEFGGHTTTHSILSNLAVDGQRREIEESLHALGRILDKPCPLFAYPNGASGDYDEDSIGCLRDAGVSVALTAMAGANPWFGDPFELRREAVGPPDLAARFAARIERMVRIDRLHAGAAT